MVTQPDIELSQVVWKLYEKKILHYGALWDSGAAVPEIPVQDLWVLASIENKDKLREIAKLPNLSKEIISEFFQLMIDYREGFSNLDYANQIDLGLSCNTSLPYEYFFEFDLNDTNIQITLFNNNSTPAEIFFLIGEIHLRDESAHDSMTHLYPRNSRAARRTTADESLSTLTTFASRANKAIRTREEGFRYRKFVENYFR